jgi:hypothetical protein
MLDDAWAIWHDKDGHWSRYVEGTVVPKAFLPAIGYVIVAFSKLDSQLDLTIAHLLGADPETGRAITASSFNYQPRISLLEQLINLKIEDKDDRKKLLKIVGKIGSVAQKRHRLIHDYMHTISYALHYGPVNPVLKVSRKENKQKLTEFTKPSLKELGSQMLDLAYRLQRFTKNDSRWKTGGSFPWRDKPQKRSPRASHRQQDG